VQAFKKAHNVIILLFAFPSMHRFFIYELAYILYFIYVEHLLH
jgi:hypothetical protein